MIRTLGILVVLSICWYLSECIDCDIEPKTNEGRLRRHLFCKYDKSSRPTFSGDPTLIKLKMILKGLDFDDHMEKLGISSWFAMSWMDDNLKWSPAEYNNINSIVELSSNFWQPDLALFNSDIASSQTEFCQAANCVVDSIGKIACIPPCLHTAKCLSDFKRWPFDTQNCSMHIGTWVNSGEEIDFEVVKTIIPETELQSQNREWKLVAATYRRNAGNFSGVTKKTYPSVTYSFTLERHSAGHITLIFSPILVFILINLTAMWISPYSGQRLFLYGLSLLSHFLSMQQLSWYVPTNGDTCPDVIYFFRDSMVITGLLIIHTIIIRSISSCGMAVPSWIQTTTTFIDSNKIGKAFIFKTYLIEKQPLHTENSEEALSADDTENGKSSSGSPRAATSMWQTIGKIIDRCMFIVIFLTYIIVLIDLIPFGYLNTKKRGDIAVIGY